LTQNNVLLKNVLVRIFFLLKTEGYVKKTLSLMALLYTTFVSLYAMHLSTEPYYKNVPVCNTFLDCMQPGSSTIDIYSRPLSSTVYFIFNASALYEAPRHGAE